MTGVNEHEKVHQVRGKIDVVVDNHPDFLPFRIRGLCVSVSRQVHEIPAAVDEEVVHQTGLSRFGGGHRQLAVGSQHID